MNIARAELFEYSLPLQTPLTLGSRSISDRRGLLLRLVGRDGSSGWGDAAPLPEFSLENWTEAVRGARRLVRTLRGTNIPDSWDPSFFQDLAQGVPSSVTFAIETAVVELLAAAQNTSVLDILGGGRTTITLNALLSDREENLERAVEQLRTDGYTTVKLKVGRRDVHADAERVRRVSRAMDESMTLRLDANRGWSLEEAIAFAEAVESVSFSYVEEPLRTPDRLAELVRHTRMPVALDETTREASPDSLTTRGPVQAVVLKPSLLGGIRETVRWVEAAHAAEVASVISASYESGVGLRMLAVLAASFTSEAAGLSTYDQLASDVLTPRPGLFGPTVHVERIYRSSVDETMLRRISEDE